MREHASPRTADTVMPANAAGAGLKPEHAEDIFGQPRQVDFFEIHAENYMGRGGPPHDLLRRIRADYPLSIHGVGLSIGGTAPLDREHLARLKHLVVTYQPTLFSEHLHGRLMTASSSTIFCHCPTTGFRWPTSAHMW